eukprot:TRINITY_DN5182_c0_g1_i1.p1 TRINITY_DN5182_c0_g1~~TRINITY_DN5182_c0_g1_i1.p1  ORF type:complete len:249 (+),score=47.11 TRINITY_DN5182_c0_g1_i1:73-819(+)
MPIKLYTSPICPFAHRAAIAAKLCLPAEEVEWIRIPLSGELTKGNAEGIESLHSFWHEKKMDELTELKEAYKKDINASGEVPTVVTSSGDIVMESEICAEYIDAISGKDAVTKLVPADPLQAAKMRLIMKKFNDVVGPGYGVLFNRDETKDDETNAKCNKHVSVFEATLDPVGPFALGAEVSLADIHAGPFFHRFQHTLKHWRSFDILAGHDRVQKLLAAFEALPAVKETTLTSEEFIASYAAAGPAR